MRKTNNDPSVIGNKYGELTVIGIQPRNEKYRGNYWICRCSCGKETTVLPWYLMNGKTRTCGDQKKHKRQIRGHYKHGGFGTRLYEIWVSMKRRCNNPDVESYPRYGGRGITVCEEWEKDFAAFRKWAMSNGYADDLTIDRIDVDGNYCAENCRWATPKEQANNRTNTVFVEYNGETHTLSEWADIVGIKYNTLHHRYKRGCTAEEMFSMNGIASSF